MNTDVTNFTEYANQLAAVLEAPGDDGIHLGPTDSALAATALRFYAAHRGADLATVAAREVWAVKGGERIISEGQAHEPESA